MRSKTSWSQALETNTSVGLALLLLSMINVLPTLQHSIAGQLVGVPKGYVGDSASKADCRCLNSSLTFP